MYAPISNPQYFNLFNWWIHGLSLYHAYVRCKFVVFFEEKKLEQKKYKSVNFVEIQVILNLAAMLDYCMH